MASSSILSSCFFCNNSPLIQTAPSSTLTTRFAALSSSHSIFSDGSTGVLVHSLIKPESSSRIHAKFDKFQGDSIQDIPPQPSVQELEEIVTDGEVEEEDDRFEINSILCDVLDTVLYFFRFEWIQYSDFE